jgi:hypothetical protein
LTWVWASGGEAFQIRGDALQDVHDTRMIKGDIFSVLRIETTEPPGNPTHEHESFSWVNLGEPCNENHGDLDDTQPNIQTNCKTRDAFSAPGYSLTRDMTTYCFPLTLTA